METIELGIYRVQESGDNRVWYRSGGKWTTHRVRYLVEESGDNRVWYLVDWKVETIELGHTNLFVRCLDKLLRL